jgi:hypothetical protein
MCRTAETRSTKMVTPTKVKHQRGQQQQQRLAGGGGGGGKGWTPPPNKQWKGSYAQAVTQQPQKTPTSSQSPRPTQTQKTHWQQAPSPKPVSGSKHHHQQQSRNHRGGSQSPTVQPHSYHSSGGSGSSTPSRGSPCFAGSKCFEPPTPDSLPKPPTSWTPTKPLISKKQLFNDVPSSVGNAEENSNETANQCLRMLLNVQA